SAVERGEGDFVTFALVADATRQRYLAIGEDELGASGRVNSELFLLFAHSETSPAFFDYERGDALLAFLRLGVDKNDSCVGRTSIGDPCFRAIHHISVGLAYRRRPKCRGVRACMRLGQRVAADFFAASKRH